MSRRRSPAIDPAPRDRDRARELLRTMARTVTPSGAVPPSPARARLVQLAGEPAVSTAEYLLPDVDQALAHVVTLWRLPERTP